MSDSSITDLQNIHEIPPNSETGNTTGMHFLTESIKTEVIQRVDSDKEDSKEVPKARTDLLEYMMRNDGSVICKLCGEVLQSRTHWYRHKYKLHVIHPLNPAPLFQCEQCLVYFKSRKVTWPKSAVTDYSFTSTYKVDSGYIGHLASRHSEILADSSPVLTNSQAEALSTEQITIQPVPPEIKEEPDPELAIPKSSVLNYQTSKTTTSNKSTEMKKTYRTQRGLEQPSNKADWEEKRSKEEKLVADIIDRVRRECEAQGSGGAARRGYTRRTTVMHTT